MRDMVEASPVDPARFETGRFEPGRSAPSSNTAPSSDTGPLSNADRALTTGRSPGSEEAVLWRRFGFDHAGTCYGFETTRSGDRSRVVINGKAALDLPRAVWAALLDAVALQRGLSGPVAFGSGALDKPERVTSALPALAGATWDQTEDDQLRAAWASGASVAELAVLHQRSRGAVATHLEKLGLVGPRRPVDPNPPLQAASH
jgi:hypothetical protein